MRDPEQIDKAKLHRVLEESGISLASIATGQAALKDGLTFTDPDTAAKKGIETVRKLL